MCNDKLLGNQDNTENIANLIEDRLLAIIEQGTDKNALEAIRLFFEWDA